MFLGQMPNQEKTSQHMIWEHTDAIHPILVYILSHICGYTFTEV
jgi:hypothetical protein